jgi:two-component system chemotaxis sensor kinase CheA
MGDSFNRDEFVAGYLAEADEHLQAAGQNLLRIEAGLDKGEPQPRAVRELFRSLHTLKGLSAMVGVEPIVAIAHEMETILRLADQRATALSRPGLELLLTGLRAIEQRVRAVSRSEPVAAAPSGLIQALQTQASSATAPVRKVSPLNLPEALLGKLAPSEQEQLAQGIQHGSRAVRIDFSPTPEKSAQGLTITSVRERVGKVADIVKVVPTSAVKSPECPGGLIFTLIALTRESDEALTKAAGVSGAEVSEILGASGAEIDVLSEGAPDNVADERESSDDALRSDTIRVEVGRLDDALEKLSQLVVKRFRLVHALERVRAQGADVRELDTLLGELGREMKQLRAAITRARMVSVDQLLERVPLLVRGMSKSAGKQVQLVIDAGRSELDKGVAERIFPAILHLVRNAIDHAIEAPEERVRRGKSPTGTVTIRAHERSDNQLELSISDDGAGIDRERVAQKANQPIPEDDAALLALITRPGLSTQDKATERSGRGMGMDIVKRIALGALGGELTLKTTPELGTTFTLRVPLSISILDSMSFRCGEQTFVAPVAMIEEIVALDSVQILRAPQPTKSSVVVSVIRQREIDVPLFDLKALFGIALLVPATAALIVRRGEQRFAFAVDKMLSQQELVIRPLEDPLVRTPGVSGTTDLGDGRPTLVLDLLGLSDATIARAQLEARSAAREHSQVQS